MTSLLHVEDLTVAFGDRDPVVRGVSFDVAPGECLAIVGESGSGKSVTARTLLGLAGAGSQVDATILELQGKPLLHNRDRDWRRIRGRQVGFVLQDALVSLDPLRTVGHEIGETLRLHRYGSRKLRRARVLELLTAVGVPEPELRARQLPHELSGGQRQRALIASAIALDPPLLIADEPTTALDVTIQAQILDLLRAMKDRGTGLVLISHDLSVVSRLADRVAVMRDGLFVEQGTVANVLTSPSHPYTQTLLDAVPAAHRKGTRLSSQPPRSMHEGHRSDPPADGVLLQADGLVKRFRGPDGVERTAVSDVSFDDRRRRDPRHRRRVRLRQDHDRASRAGAAGTRRGHRTTCRRAMECGHRGRAQTAPQAHLGDLPGSVELIRPAVDGPQDHRGRAARRPVPQTPRRATSAPASYSPTSASRTRTSTGDPCSCPAASDSASRSPGRWHPNRP